MGSGQALDLFVGEVTGHDRQGNPEPIRHFAGKGGNQRPRPRRAGRGAQDQDGNASILVDQFQKLRNEISSVNMDEEVADMVQFQRGFDAAARFITTVDEMTETVINM